MSDRFPVARVQTRVSVPPDKTSVLLPPAFRLGQKTSGTPVLSGVHTEKKNACQ